MIFINEHRQTADSIIAAVKSRLDGKATALAALDEGVRECYSEHAATDYPLHKLLISSPVVTNGDRREQYNGTEIILAALDTEAFDDESRCQLFLALADVYLKNRRSLNVIRLASAEGPAARMLTPPRFRKMQFHLAVLMLCDGENLFAAKQLMATWDEAVANSARAEAYAAHPQPAGIAGGSILNDITDSKLRATTLRRRIEAEQAAGRRNMAAKLRRLQVTHANLRSHLRVIK